MVGLQPLPDSQTIFVIMPVLYVVPTHNKFEKRVNLN